MSTESLLDNFVAKGRESNFKLKISAKFQIKYEPLTNDALFHLPFISICILVLARELENTISTGDVGRCVGLLIEKTVSGFKGSSQQLGLSATLRHRVVESIICLEDLDFLKVEKSRNIKITEEGRKFLLTLKKDQTSLGVAVRGLFRNVQDIPQEARNLL